jgi:hypothetical protein
MSGPGDIGGEVSGEEAAWRDLVARFELPADPENDESPWPSREDLSAGTAVADAAAPPDEPAEPGDGPAGKAGPADRARVIRYAGDPRSYSPPDETDEPYVPAPLPPAGKLDPVAKGAWAALICGPGYLLIATLLGWTVSGIAALLAIGAFIAGFVILVLRMGDRPPRDDDDDGAVV